MGKNKRFDAVRIKDLDGFHSIVPYIMPKRSESEVSLTQEFDITALNKYIEERNKEAGTNLKLFHCIATAVAKTIYHRPLMNTFIAGKCFYKRNDITLSFVAKQTFNDEAQELLMFIKAKPEMNVNDFSKLILGDVKTARSKKTNDVGDLMDKVGKLPRFILEIFFWLLRAFEYFGVYPKSLAAGDPNYSTVLMSNLGSIGSNSCYHHLSNFGTNSIMMTIGTIKHDEMTGKDSVEMTFTLDERIADGFYFAKSLRLFNYVFENPAELAEPISKEVPEDLFK